MAEKNQQRAQRRRDRLMDRWIDLVAASYGMPRIVLLREIQTPLHLAREVARIVAQQQQREAAEAAEAKAKREREEAEMKEYLAELKRQQQIDRGELVPD